jgi:hypothetical protein
MANIITEVPPTVTEKTTSYVDDISLTQIAPTYQESTHRLMERSQEKALWANIIGLLLATNKYELIHLSVKKKQLIRIAVLPAMLWGSPTWWNKTPSVLDPLSKAYNKMARWITGLPITTKTENLLTCAHLPLLDAY